MSFLRDMYLRHERLKRTVHEGWRYPLPPWGRAVMGFLYFSLPVVAGWHVMQWAIGKSHASIGEHGERLPVQTIQGIGDKVAAAAGSSKNDKNAAGDAPADLEKLGAGGWGGGVNLAVSDEETQKHNMEMLHKFLRRQKRKAKEEEQNAAAAPAESDSKKTA